MTDLGTRFVRWTWCRAVLHRGWWLVTSVYLVVDARLSASQLVLIGVAQGIVALVCEVPAGVVADALSRKWSLVVSHLLMGTAMLATGLVTTFGPLLLTQMLWGLSWTFASGADVAWISDELDDPDRVPTVLLRAERAQLTGTVVGLLGIGALAWLTRRDTAIVLAGAAMLLLGGYVATAFRETRFVARRKRILARGISLVRGSRVLLVILAATFVVNGLAGSVGRLYQLRLVDVGLSVDPVLWFTGLGVVTSLAGAAALRLVQPHIEGAHTARRGYAVACLLAGVGVGWLAVAPEEVGGSAAIVLAAGAFPLARGFGVIWVNAHTHGAVRATVHSLFAQADYAGAVVCGLALAAVSDLFLSLVTSGALLVAMGLLVAGGTFGGPKASATRIH
ncbi:hypothetical protein GCM10009557_67160 [Virgisporangium ochraceum]